MNVKMYLPNAKFAVGVIIVLVVLTLILRFGAGNQYVQRARHYVGLSA
jgi:hypothetical protein